MNDEADLEVHLAAGRKTACGLDPVPGVYSSLNIRNVNCKKCLAEAKKREKE